ncbi:MAG: hypothetical protein PVS3B3_06420 [Ktedonobacteraceae bacterium]
MKISQTNVLYRAMSSLKESETEGMKQYQTYRNDENTLHSMHNQATDPLMRSVTAPQSTPYVLKETRSQRIQRTVNSFFAAIFRKINQLIGLALVVLVLLLCTRFLLNFFEITTSVFTGWVHMLTAPLVYPFENLVPSLPYNGFSIDMTTLVAIVVWIIAVLLVRQFIRVLLGKW